LALSATECQAVITPESYSLRAMPIYEYKCKKGHVFEVMQSFSDEALTKCEVCGAPVQRVYHPVSVHFKGSGFYNTDYGTKRRAREAKENKESSSSSSSEGSSSSESKSEGSKSESSKSSDSGKSSSSDSKAAA
jgi:putative FmdB family regulatory protein